MISKFKHGTCHYLEAPFAQGLNGRSPPEVSIVLKFHIRAGRNVAKQGLAGSPACRFAAQRMTHGNEARGSLKGHDLGADAFSSAPCLIPPARWKPDRHPIACAIARVRPLQEAFGDVDDYTRKGGLKTMGEALDRGMVLVMSLWDDAAPGAQFMGSWGPVF